LARVLDTRAVLGNTLLMADQLPLDPEIAADQLPLDPEIAALCDDAADWPAAAMADHLRAREAFTGITTAAWYAALAAALLLTGPRVHTGYMPAEQRKDVAHRAYSEGLRTPPKRADRWDRARAHAQQWGLA
jgi:hypothetical protein